MRADSVHMFFNTAFALVPPACANIRREARMDAASGSFLGEVRDYNQLDNTLLHKVQYVNGLREGAYEQHYLNQRMAVSGQFAQGRPVGTWQYWYANGRRWQTLELQNAEPMRIVAYWDSTGRQHVTDGTGIWEENVAGSLPTHTSGRVVAGLMDGTWERRSRTDKQVLTSEEYRDGSLQQGRQYIGMAGKPKIYKTRSLLGPQVLDASAPLEPYHFGMSCEAQAQLAAAQEQAAARVMVQPTPPREPGAYQQELLRRLATFNNLTQWMPRTDGQSTVITADIDEKGYLSSFVSESGTLSNAFATIMQDLGAWHPAKVDGQPVPGKVRITLRIYSTQLQSSLQANIAYPLPAVLTPKTN